ncbi:MAG: Asp-tRNA(Asn)/Glu-tRNA(Gln) amidotransferase subunit GatB, partial [Oscillospiraceae bacterium]|nr:Asp-tRNA(Asn)/Glu-tRNA(Gln) amidotransferase subunit GatB [Oscillospiraceae bacterium]
GAAPNANTCPACMGMPGSIPVLNKTAAQLGIKAGLVTDSEITRRITFDKKNYFYPDLPAGFQTTQWFSPVCKNGSVEIKTESGTKKIRIKQIHLEEDAGKLVHSPGSGSSFVDLNRAGVPLIEIVSEADFRSADEVTVYLQKLRLLFTYAGISDCKMHEGSMRADINISIREFGETRLGTRVEIKNLNSIKAIIRAIGHESARQIDLAYGGGAEDGEKIIRETRRWDDDRNMSFSMRNKEDAADYRYFPAPDVPPVVISEDRIEEVRASVPELAHQKSERFKEQYALSAYDAEILTENKRLSEIFEEVAAGCGSPKEAANWLIVELLGLIKTDGREIEDTEIDPKKIAALIKSVLGNVINRTSAKEIFAKIYSEDIDPDEYIKTHNLGMVSDNDLLYKLCAEALDEDPDGVTKYKNGNAKVFGSFVGSVMRKMKGKADTVMVNNILKELLGE